MRYRIKTTDTEHFRRVLELLVRFNTIPVVSSEQRCLVAVDDLSDAALGELESLDASVTKDFQYLAER